MTSTHHFQTMKKILFAAVAGSAITAATLTPAPAYAWGGLVMQGINMIESIGNANAQARYAEAEVQKMSTEEAIQAEVERRLAAERKAWADQGTRPAQTAQQQNSSAPSAEDFGQVMDAITGSLNEAMPGMSTMLGVNGLGDSMRAGMGGQIQGNTVSIITGCGSFGDGGLQNAISQGFRVVAKHDWTCGSQAGTKFILSR